MGFVPGYAVDVFISYTHLDDQAVKGEVGWVSDLHDRLAIQLGVALGSTPAIWRDQRMGAGTRLSAALERSIRDSAILLPIISPSYVNSEWCVWELKGFTSGERRRGPLAVDDVSRVVPVVRRPPLDDPSWTALVSDTLRMDFYGTDTQTQLIQEMSLGSEARATRIDNLAQSLAKTLKAMRRARTTYLGAAPPSLQPQRAKLQRELEANNYAVLFASEDNSAGAVDGVGVAMAQAGLSVLFADDTPNDVNADAASHAVAAAEVTAAGAAAVRQIMVRHQSGKQSVSDQAWRDIEKLVEAPHVDVLVNSTTETVKETVIAALESGRTSRTEDATKRVYFICGHADHPLLEGVSARGIRDELQRHGVEVKLPLAEGSSRAEFSRHNRQKLKECNAVLLYWGASPQVWFEERLSELQQAVGWRGGRRFDKKIGYLAPPENSVKKYFETRDVDVLIKEFELSDSAIAALLGAFQPPPEQD